MRARTALAAGLVAAGLAATAPAQTSGNAGNATGGRTGASGTGGGGGGSSTAQGTAGATGALGAEGTTTGDANGTIAAGSLVGGFGNIKNQASANGVSSANPFVEHYFNPLAQGYPTGALNVPFGTAVYASTTAGGRTGATAGVNSRTGTAATTTSSTATANTGINTLGRRPPSYVTTVKFAGPPAPAVQLVPQLQATLQRSSRLPSAAAIEVLADGGTVVLRGTVADDDERRLAEGLLRLTPGVREVRNELAVR